MREKIKDSKITELVNEVMEKLKDLNPYIYHVSRYNTVYINFQDSRLRKLRIGDHLGRSKGRCKWNIIIGEPTRERSQKSGIKRYYFNEKSTRLFVLMITKYHKDILGKH